MTSRNDPGSTAEIRRYLYGLIAANIAIIGIIVAFFAYHDLAQDRAVREITGYHSATIRAAQAAQTEIHNITDLLLHGEGYSGSAGLGQKEAGRGGDLKDSFSDLLNERDTILALQRRYANPDLDAVTEAVRSAFDTVQRDSDPGQLPDADIPERIARLNALWYRLDQLSRLHMAANDRLAVTQGLGTATDPKTLIFAVAALTAIGAIAGLRVVRHVTEIGSARGAALRALQKSEARLASIARGLESAQRIARLGSWEWEIGSELESWSDQNYRNLGLTPGSCESTVARFYEIVHPDDRARCSAVVRQAVDAGVGYDLDFRVVWKDGSVHAMREHAEPVYGSDGGLVALRGTLQDVTAESETQRELEKLARRLSNAQRIARIGNWEWDAGTNEEWWSDEVFRILGLDAGSVTACFETFIERVHPDDRDAQIASIEATQSGKAPPYIIDIRIVRSDGSERVIRETGEALFDDDGKLLGLSGTTQDITERSRAEAELAKAVRGLNRAQQIARIGSWEWDAASRRHSWSDESFRILGLEPGSAEPDGETFTRFVHPDDLERVRAHSKELFTEGAPLAIEYRIFRADGEERVLAVQAEMERDRKGDPLRVVGTAQDITDRKRVEAKLANTVRDLNRAQEIARLGSWEWNVQTNTQEWSDQTYRIFDLVPGSIETLNGGTFLSFVHPDDRGRLSKDYEEALRSPRALSLEYRIVTAAKAEKTVAVQALLERDEDGNPARMSGIIHDITERKQAERNLAEAVRSLNDAQRLARIGSWDWDIPNNREYWSDECYRLHGLEPGSVDFAGLDFLEYVHPDDRGAAREAHERALADGTPIDVEFRLRCADGTERIVHTNGEVIHDGQGRPIRVSGTIQDITDRRRQEAQLRATEERFALAFRLSPGMTTISEVDTGVHLDVNDKWVETMGYSRDEVIGRSSLELGVWEDVEDRNRVIAMLRKDGQFRGVEVRLRTREGELRDFLISGEPFPLGDRPHVLIIGHDITERKRIERELRESETRLNAFFAAAPAGLALYDRDGRYTKINETLAASHGRPIEAHIGKRPSEVLPKEFARIVEDGNRKAIEQGEQVVNEEISLPLPGAKNDMINCVFSRFPIVDETGRPSGVGVVSVDISELKRTQKELSRLNAELERRVEDRTAELHAAQEELVRSERLATLGQLTATVSHELRNPLGAMRTSLYVIEKKADQSDERIAKAIARVNRSITRCDNIIDELLDFTRIRDLEFREVGMESWLDGLLDEQPMPEGAAVRRNFTAGDPRIAIDPDRLRRAVINVFENACQAVTGTPDAEAPKGGHKVTVTTRAVGNRFEIIVDDSGPGIAGESLDRIFEPLFSTKNFGVGLGLSVVRQIMEQHGGGIDAKNRKPRGARFVLWLPAEGRRLEDDEP